jgi:hypothetical protein
MAQLDLLPLTAVGRDALTRSIQSAMWFQQREGHLRVLPDLLPDQDTPGWIELGQRCASLAQTMKLLLAPWQAAPADVHDDGEIADCHARRESEVAYQRRLRSAGLSIFEPDPDRALMVAERAGRARA